MPSTAIGKIDYDAATQSLWIRFVTNGRRYLYSGVPPEVADAFRRAFSKGTFFNRHIRDHYEATLVDDPKRIAQSSTHQLSVRKSLLPSEGEGARRADEGGISQHPARPQ